MLTPAGLGDYLRESGRHAWLWLRWRRGPGANDDHAIRSGLIAIIMMNIDIDPFVDCREAMAGALLSYRQDSATQSCFT